MEPVLQGTWDYWRKKVGDGDIPDRAAIVPTDIPELLPHVYMVDVVDGGARFRYRLVGSNIVDRVGFNATGKFLSEVVQGEHERYMANLFRQVVSTRHGIYSRSAYRYPDRDFVSTSRIFLPLTRGGREVAIILAAQVFGFARTEDLREFVTILSDDRNGNDENRLQSSKRLL